MIVVVSDVGDSINSLQMIKTSVIYSCTGEINLDGLF